METLTYSSGRAWGCDSPGLLNFFRLNGRPVPYFNNCDHRHRGGIVLIRTSAVRSAGREDLSTGVAPQPFYLEHGRLQGRLPHNAHQCSGLFLTVDFPFAAFRNASPLICFFVAN